MVVAKSESVLLVANYASDVGYAWWLMENFWVEAAQLAHSRGRMSVLAYPKITIIPESIGRAPIKLVEQSLRPKTISDMVAVIRLIRNYRVRSIYVTDWPAFSWQYLVWRLIGVRSIVLHDHTPGDRPKVTGIRGWFKATAHRLGWFSCSAYVGVSDYIRQRLIDNWCVPPSRALVVRNGIRPFECDPLGKDDVRARLGIPIDAVMIVLVSRATYYKGWDFAIRCAAELVRSLPSIEFQLVFCGDGPDLPAFRNLACDLGVGGRARFLGRRDDVRSIICSADLAFHPSRGEAMSLATLEFMCAGLPVVVPDRPSVCGVIDQQITGLIYKSEDVTAAVTALATLCADGELRASLGRNARAVMYARHQLSETNSQFRVVVASHLL